MVLRHRSVRQPLELEIVIVPAKAKSGVADLLADLTEAFAEALPAGRVARPGIGGEIGTGDQLDAQRFGDVARPGKIVFQQLEREVPAGHGKTVCV